MPLRRAGEDLDEQRGIQQDVRVTVLEPGVSAHHGHVGIVVRLGGPGITGRISFDRMNGFEMTATVAALSSTEAGEGRSGGTREDRLASVEK